MKGLPESTWFLYVMLGLVLLLPVVIRVIAIILTKRWGSPKLNTALGVAARRFKEVLGERGAHHLR